MAEVMVEIANATRDDLGVVESTPASQGRGRGRNYLQERGRFFGLMGGENPRQRELQRKKECRDKERKGD